MNSEHNHQCVVQGLLSADPSEISIQQLLSFSDRRIIKMPEGSGQGGGGGGHAVLEGSYELHDTVDTGGFAKVR